MTWNYRVLKQRCPFTLEQFYGIHEVYYSKHGSLRSYTEDAIRVVGSTPKELRRTLKLMKGALKKPVLTTEDFKK